MHRILALCTLVLLLQSCGSKEAKNGDANKLGIAVSGDSIVNPANSPILSKISCVTVKERNYSSQFTTTGTVKVMAGCSAEVATPFEGRISRSFIKLGQKVKARAPIFEVLSSEYFETVKGYVQAKQEKLLAGNAYSRQKDLMAHAVGAKKDLEEAEAAFRIAQKELERAEASLKIFNVKPSDAAMGKPLVVRSPISGEVVKCNLTVGQYLKGDAEPVVTVANLDKVWVVARVKEKSIGLIGQHDKVQVTTDAYPGKPVSGEVTYVGSLLDEETRSVEFYIECSNGSRMLKPGMFASVAFDHKNANAIVLPASAIMQDANGSYLFVKVGNNKFARRVVTTTSCNEREVIIRSGINVGDVVVAKGGVLLR
jgi:membrane fusion protein, heavy metal efflux system